MKSRPIVSDLEPWLRENLGLISQKTRLADVAEVQVTESELIVVGTEVDADKVPMRFLRGLSRTASGLPTERSSCCRPLNGSCCARASPASPPIGRCCLSCADGRRNGCGWS
jgi:hypothetical protein